MTSLGMSRTEYLDKTAEAALEYVRRRKTDIPIFQDSDSGNLLIEELGGGNTNFNYVVWDASFSKKSKGVFVKHAKGFAKGFGESAKMSTIRLYYEYQGMKEFTNFGFTIPDCFLYDSDEHYLVTSFLDGYEPFITQLQRLEIDTEVAEAMGGIMGHCHAGTHVDVVPPAIHNKYLAEYSNKEHFDLWDEHFFPMIMSRLKDPKLFRQTPDVANFGEEHYSRVRDFMENAVDLGAIQAAVEQVKNVYMNKKTTLVHADLHANNIMIKKNVNAVWYESCDLEKVRMIDHEKFAVGPPGIDIGQYITNYLYFQATVSLFSERYLKIEETLKFFYKCYVEAFEVHSEMECKSRGTCLLPDARQAIIEENMRDAVGFIGWWTLSLVASCPVDVMPLPEKAPVPAEVSRMNHLKLAINFLYKYHSGEKVTSIQDIIDLVRLSRIS